MSTADREDARLRWVDDCTEVGDVEHAQVGNGEGSALEFLWLQLSVTRFGCERLHVVRNRFDAFAVGTEDDRRDQSVVGGDGDGNVNGVESENCASCENSSRVD